MSISIKSCLTIVFGVAFLFCILPSKAQLSITTVQKVSNKSGGLGNILSTSEGFSERVANIGDLNGDGVSDIACASAGDPDGGDRNGAVFILFMNNDGTVNKKQKISKNNGNLGLTFPSSDYLFGYSVASIGDLNSDGVNDLAVGIITGNDSYTGSVAILFMKSDGTVKSTTLIDKNTSALSTYLTGGNFFGCGVQGIGDINGDGVNDLAVGAQSEENSKGAAYILFLNANGTVKSIQRIANNTGGVPNILAANDNFGVSIANLGDIDEDGINDLAIGSYGDNEVAKNVGCVYIAHLKGDGTIKKLSKINTTNITLDDISNSNFGNSVCSIKDLNGDGIKDLLVGAVNDGPHGEGALYIIYLDSNTDVKSYQKITSQTTGFTTYLNNGNRFGCGIAPFDNYDSTFSIAVGASGDADGSSGTGAFYVLHLKSPNITTGIKNKKTINFSLYPNPTSGRIFLSSNDNDPFAVQIFELTGSCIYSSQYALPNKDNSNSVIDISNVKPGLYLLQIRSNDQTFNYKIIKN